MLPILTFGKSQGRERSSQSRALQFLHFELLKFGRRTYPYGGREPEEAGNDAAHAGMVLTSLFYIEANLKINMDGLAQRMRTRMAFKMYFQAARATAAAGNFQQALGYAENIRVYEDRLLAASEIILRYEALRRALGTTNLDFVADWGNRNWDDARKQWIRRNPSH